MLSSFLSIAKLHPLEEVGWSHYSTTWNTIRHSDTRKNRKKGPVVSSLMVSKEKVNTRVALQSHKRVVTFLALLRYETSTRSALDAVFSHRERVLERTMVFGEQDDV